MKESKKILKLRVWHAGVVAVMSVAVLLMGAHFLWTGDLHTSALGQSLNDQTGYITTARNIAEKGKLESTVYYPAKLLYYRSHNLPAYMPGNYYVRAFFFSIFGYSLFVSFLPNLLSFIGSAVLLFLICDNVFDRKTAYISTVLMLTFPPFVLYAFTAMMESLFVFTCLLSFYIFIMTPLPARSLVGPLSLVPAIFVRETAVFMLFGYAAMIFLDGRERWFRNLTVFILVSLGSLYLIYLVPAVADRPSAFYARLLNSAGIHYFDAYALQGMRFTFKDTVALIWLHFFDNLRIFFAMLTGANWHEGFKLFVLSIGIILISTAFLLFSKRTKKSVAVFAVVTALVTLAATFILYDYYGYTGSRLLLFILPFHVSIIVNAFLEDQFLPRKMTAIVVVFVCVISFSTLRNSLGYFHKDFVSWAKFDNACADFLDSLGVSQIEFFSAPFEISLDYVNRHYPLKWSFLPSDERTLRLLSQRYAVDMLIVPLGHRLAAGGENAVKRSLLDGTFRLTRETSFLNKQFLVYRRSSGTALNHPDPRLSTRQLR